MTGQERRWGKKRDGVGGGGGEGGMDGKGDGYQLMPKSSQRISAYMRMGSRSHSVLVLRCTYVSIVATLAGLASTATCRALLLPLGNMVARATAGCPRHGWGDGLLGIALRRLATPTPAPRKQASVLLACLLPSSSRLQLAKHDAPHPASPLVPTLSSLSHDVGSLLHPSTTRWLTGSTV